jgi:hypothetical protein
MNYLAMLDGSGLRYFDGSNMQLTSPHGRSIMDVTVCALIASLSNVMDAAGS